MAAARLDIVCLLGLALCACGGGKNASTASQGSGDPGTATAKVAALALPAVTGAVIAVPVTLPATATDKSGGAVTGESLTWSSADPTVATIGSDGVVTPVRAGFTTITVTSNGVSASGRAFGAGHDALAGAIADTWARTCRGSPTTRRSFRSRT